MKIRDANENDLDVLYQFEQEIIKVERVFDSTLKNEEFHYYDFRKLIDAAFAKMLVAEVDNEIVGSGFAEIKKSDHDLKHPEFAYIGLMYVKPFHRGKGINGQMLLALKNWITTKGVTEIRLFVYDDNTAGKNAYQKAGFRAHVVEMRLEI